MRVLLFLLASVLAFTAAALTTTVVGAGDKKAGKEDPKKAKEKEKEKEQPTVSDIGGKGLKDWIADIKSPDRSKGATALKTVLLFGVERAKLAIPTILAELKRHRPGISTVDASFLVNAPTTLTAIITSVKKPDPEQVKDIIKALTALSKDPQIVVRYRAIQSLTSFGPYAAKDALTRLIELTKDLPTWETRHAAVVALGMVGQPMEKGKEPENRVIHALYAALKDKASGVRVAAINSLQRLRIPELATHKRDFEAAVEPVALKDEEPLVKIQAHLALYTHKTKVTAAQRRALIAKLLTHQETAVRLEAARVLGALGKDSLDQVSTLLGIIEDREGLVGAAAIWSIASIGRKDTGTKRILAAYVQKHEKPEVRVELCKAIGALGEDGADLIPPLLKVAQADKEPAIRVTAILAIANMGQAAFPYIADLRTIGGDKKQQEVVRQAAKDAADFLLKIKEKGKEKEKSKESSKKGAAR